MEAGNEGPVPRSQRPLATPQPRSGCCLSGEGRGSADGEGPCGAGTGAQDKATLLLAPRWDHELQAARAPHSQWNIFVNVFIPKERTGEHNPAASAESRLGREMTVCSGPAFSQEQTLIYMLRGSLRIASGPVPRLEPILSIRQRTVFLPLYSVDFKETPQHTLSKKNTLLCYKNSRVRVLRL